MSGRGSLVQGWYRAGTWVANVFVLNLLWLCCSLPIVTLPPTIAATLATIRQWSQEGEERVLGVFFSEWRRLCRRSYQLAWPQALAGAVLAVELAHFVPQRDAVSAIMSALAVGFLLALLVIAVHAWAILVEYDGSAAEVWRAALYLGARGAGTTLAVAIPVWLGAALLLVWFPAALACGVIPGALWLSYLGSRHVQRSLQKRGEWA